MSDIIAGICKTVNIFPSDDFCEKCGGWLDEIDYTIDGTAATAGQKTYRCRSCGHKQVKTCHTYD